MYIFYSHEDTTKNAPSSAIGILNFASKIGRKFKHQTTEKIWRSEQLRSL